MNVIAKRRRHVTERHRHARRRLCLLACLLACLQMTATAHQERERMERHKVAKSVTGKINEI